MHKANGGCALDTVDHDIVTLAF